MKSSFHKVFASGLSLCAFILFSFGLSASLPYKDVASSSDAAVLNYTITAISKTDNLTVENSFEYAAEQTPENEKILVVLVDSYGMQNYSKVVITDVNMELSILIVKDIFDKIPNGIYTVVASSANDLISQKLIVQ